MEQFKDGSHRRLGAVFLICFLVSLTYHVVNIILGLGMGGDGGFPQVVATIFKLDKSELVDLGCAGSVTWWHKSTPIQNCLLWFFFY